MKFLTNKSKHLFLVLSILSTPFAYAQEKGLDERINDAFTPIANWWESLILHNFPGTEIPTIIFLLVGGALFFTIYFGFINIKRFPTAINTVRGKYDAVEDSSDDGEVSHFQALATAVSGTVGNGNIAGVALAIAVGGPGATFWMVVCGLIGMSTKFVECTLGVKYRDVGEDGTVYGGPMYYLTRGLEEKGFAKIGKVLGVIFALLCIGASFGGGNAAQSNQAAMQLVETFGMEGGSARTIIGVILMVVVGVIIIGGIKRIASVTEKVVPFMALMYILACLYIILSNFWFIDDAFGMIFSQAFSPQAGLGGFLGVLITGFRRAAFSNEAGAGSASIAHSAVKTKYAASEGLVALLEPFIDTVVICTMTALVIIIFNGDSTVFSYGGEGGKVLIDGLPVEGAGITAAAFAKYISFSGPFLTIAVVLFAVSTMISWSYYGLQSWMFVFGKSKISDLTYKSLFLIFIVIGAAGDMSSVWAFSDAMILALVFPNMIGLLILFPTVKEELNKYLEAIKTVKS
ncbi:alanine:cation symporter family protein [Flavobacteriaceae bacterium]|uniref:alanine/glycine:cation symporter family protein n=1 Tax=Candidatus Arcticimaribacter forsetii TaxID=2820661 RepID=UPI0020772654|nr:alanine/glycine:cation symporter family protein [Candidatus Arcticimaribacter forsetii]MDA8699174.1 alanine:cation symporter family protein [Flavobacteriaceae bacterium]MDB2345476.1 alanine:cation symporter family protein [Flavobacteriaceae bacterium]MDB4674834.1 alanine:cation symporter family protein [Flavobacteriaceae bacterium]